MESKACLSCKHKVENDPGHVSFNCPSCSKYDIVRCSQCRIRGIKYSCPNCTFSGPN